MGLDLGFESDILLSLNSDYFTSAEQCDMNNFTV